MLKATSGSPLQRSQHRCEATTPACPRGTVGEPKGIIELNGRRASAVTLGSELIPFDGCNQQFPWEHRRPRGSSKLPPAAPVRRRCNGHEDTYEDRSHFHLGISRYRGRGAVCIPRIRGSFATISRCPRVTSGKRWSVRDKTFQRASPFAPAVFSLCSAGNSRGLVNRW